MNEIIIASISGLIIVVGLVGTFLPFLPGPQLSIVGLILYAWATKFEFATPTGVIVLSVLTLLTILFDIFGPALGARGYKSSSRGAWGAIIGGFLGIFVLGPVGGFVGPFVGAFIGEFSVNPNHTHALRAAWGAFVGIMLGTLFKLSVATAILGYFVYAIIRSL